MRIKTIMAIGEPPTPTPMKNKTGDPGGVVRNIAKPKMVTGKTTAMSDPRTANPQFFREKQQIAAIIDIAPLKNIAAPHSKNLLAGQYDPVPARMKAPIEPSRRSTAAIIGREIF